MNHLKHIQRAKTEVEKKASSSYIQKVLQFSPNESIDGTLYVLLRGKGGTTFDIVAVALYRRCWCLDPRPLLPRSWLVG